MNLGSLIFTSVLFLSSTSVLAQRYGSLGPSHDGGPPIRFGFAHVAFSVPDIDASVKWYERMLNFRLLETATLKGGVKAVQMINGGMHVELFQATRAGDVAPMDLSTAGIKHGAFLVKDVDVLASELRSRGVKVLSVGHFASNPRADVCFILDNSGNTIEFIQPLTGDRPF